jgi:hypothetical protein
MGWKVAAGHAGQAIDATQGVGQPVLAGHVPDEADGVGAGAQAGRPSGSRSA